MTSYVALLRAVNVGTGRKLLMTDLRALCEKAGFSQVRSYIQSGNVLFESRLAEAKVKATLEKSLSAHMKIPVGVMVRSASELASVVAKNPFHGQPSNRVMAVFLDQRAPKSALDGLVAPGSERVQLSGREIFVYYPEGQGRSKLRLPALATGTARNMNTVAKLAELLSPGRA